MRIIIRITRNNNYKSHTRVKVVHFRKRGQRHTDRQQIHRQTADIQTDRDIQTDSRLTDGQQTYRQTADLKTDCRRTDGH